KRIAVLLEDDDKERVRIWDAISAKPLADFAPATKVYAMSITADGSDVVVGGSDGNVTLLAKPRVFEQPHKSRVTSIVVSPDGNRLITVSSSDGITRLRDIAGGLPV